ncbi:MAG: c-type cytochrome [Dehalococcoidia bacterium]|nr:c-type cytochrome [Dehalococcoidia bacterium]
MNSKWLLAATLSILLFAVSSAAVLAQEPPPPYAGVKNPFAWNDAGVLSAGKTVYEQFCGSCHGATGAGVSAFDFSSASYSKQLEAKPDSVFWALSEGRITKGMPPYKSTLSEEKRWQVITYIHSLGGAPSTPGPTPAATPPVENGSLTLSVPPAGQTGDPVTFTATLKDGQGKPRTGEKVKFLLLEDFFARGLVEAGEATTDGQGVAALEYIPRRPGEPEVVAWFGKLETRSRIAIADSGDVFYHTEAGIRMPAPGPEIWIGPESAFDLGPQGNAPNTALRLPGGMLSWLWLFVLVLIAVYVTYIVTLYQVLRISTVKGAGATNASLVPRMAILAMIGLGVMVVLMVITGPYSHFHLG